ncbi:unnamed protein product [Adineta ricciae]|uniref:Peptidase A2 domain-containing protein n=1 Tax=Adineta ricciae TaxID=249248 RepID=A0A816DXL0_ADIRI|nr:unnamed protein product [Adineta ricciae]CAF1639575.1 unnamed protein product [Adineta ricciae]
MATNQTSNQLHKFDPTLFDWNEWEILFDTYLAVEGVSDDSKKRNLLITSLDVQPFKTLVSICKPSKPTTLTYLEVITKLRTNYAKVTFSSTERIKFFALKQEVSQSLTDFANILRNKATACDFPAVFYEQALITAFVGGLRDKHVRKHMMQKNLKTMEATINSAKTIESVLIEGASTQGRTSDELEVNKGHKQDIQEANSNQKIACASCGSHDHARSTCRFRKLICRTCKKQGHIAKVCRSSTSDDEKTINSVLVATVQNGSSNQSYEIQMSIDDIPVTLQLDTGSPRTLLTESVWVNMGKPRLKRIQMGLHSFTGHQLTLKGEKTVNVEYNGKSIQLPVFIVNGFANNILGRDWIYALNLNARSLNEIASMNSLPDMDLDTQNLSNMVIDYSDELKRGLICDGDQAELHIKHLIK